MVLFVPGEDQPGASTAVGIALIAVTE